MEYAEPTNFEDDFTKAARRIIEPVTSEMRLGLSYNSLGSHTRSGQKHLAVFDLARPGLQISMQEDRDGRCFIALTEGAPKRTLHVTECGTAQRPLSKESIQHDLGRWLSIVLPQQYSR